MALSRILRRHDLPFFGYSGSIFAVKGKADKIEFEKDLRNLICSTQKYTVGFAILSAFDKMPIISRILKICNLGKIYDMKSFLQCNGVSIFSENQY